MLTASTRSGAFQVGAPGFAVAARAFARSRSRNSPRMILPEVVVGKLSTNSIARGYSWRATSLTSRGFPTPVQAKSAGCV
jgi:hypothetical protein